MHLRVRRLRPFITGMLGFHPAETSQTAAAGSTLTGRFPTVDNPVYMPKRTTGLTEANARLHKNHAFEFQVAAWLMQDGWQVFAPLLDAAHAVDFIVSDGPRSYRIQIKSVTSQD